MKQLPLFEKKINKKDISDHAWRTFQQKDWIEIEKFVRSYISKKVWDTRLNKNDVTQECLLYILENCRKSYVTKSYLKFYILNFLNRKLSNGAFSQCLKTLFHDANFLSFEDTKKLKGGAKHG